MSTSCKPLLGLLLCASILTSLLPVSLSRPLPESPTPLTPTSSEYTDLLPLKQHIVVDSVFMPPTNSRTVPIPSRVTFTLTLTLRLLVSAMPMNPVYYSVPVEVSLEGGRNRKLLLRELRSSCGKEGCQGKGEVNVWVHKPIPKPSLGRQVLQVVTRAARFWSLLITSLLTKTPLRDFV